MLKHAVFMTLSSAALLAGCGDKPLTYEADIKPILDANCVECHVPDGKGFKKSGLLMESYESLMKGTNLGPVVVPGSSISSTLYRVASGQADPSIRMPHGKGPLPDKDIATIAAWIDQGAKN